MTRERNPQGGIQSHSERRAMTSGQRANAWLDGCERFATNHHRSFVTLRSSVVGYVYLESTGVFVNREDLNPFRQSILSFIFGTNWYLF
mgnify:CR=1 FL=1